jgi:spore photoproduct lyase
MNDEDRSYKYGQFGYGKYIYSKESLKEMADFFREDISTIFQGRAIDIKYII